MATITTNEACKKILEHYGLQPQKIKLMEELAELIQATAKAPESLITDSMVEEIADVQIMLEQMLCAMSKSQEQLLHDLISYKLMRQKMRMEGE